jgi:hypothetical protein
MLFSGDPLPDVHRRSLANVPAERISDLGRSDRATLTSTWGIAPGRTQR